MGLAAWCCLPSTSWRCGLGLRSAQKADRYCPRASATIGPENIGIRCLPVGQQSSEFVARLDQHWKVTWLLNGVNVFNEPTIECRERLSDTSPDYEQLGLNTLNKHWPEARALRDHLPPDILDRVVEFATSYQQLVSAPSNVRQHCPLIRRARKPTVTSRVQNMPNRKRGKKRKKRCKNQTKT
ncbi:hypothetical protein WJX82_000586 [Trebouxia sp. C0006]